MAPFKRVFLLTLAIGVASCGDDDTDDTSADADTDADADSDTDTDTDTDGTLHSCDQRTLQNQCHTYANMNATELSVLESACDSSQGIWGEGGCPEPYDAACIDYSSGSITMSSYYYETLGLTEETCTTFGGTWESTLPSYAGSCWPTAYECQAFEASWDTPATVEAACGDGTYDADRCTTTDLVGSCFVPTTSTTFNYYTGYPNLDYVKDTLCGLMGGEWTDA